MKALLPVFLLCFAQSHGFAWDLKPDPPKDPPWELAGNLAVPINEQFDQIEFADLGGPFALLDIGEKKKRRVIDLRSGEQIAEFDCGDACKSYERETLSPDGKIWVQKIGGLSKGAKLLHTSNGIELGAMKWEGQLLSLGFAAKDRIVVTQRDRTQRSAELFEATTGKSLAKWPLEGGSFAIAGQPTREFSVSPGGLYLAVVSGSKALVYTLADGKKVAELEMPPSTARKPGDAGAGAVVAFSADGQQLGALTAKDPKGIAKLLIWSLKDGSKSESEFDRTAKFPGTSSCQLAPVLSGGWLIDCEAIWVGDQIVRSLPFANAGCQAKLAVSAERVVGLSGVLKLELKVLGGTQATSAFFKAGKLEGAKLVPGDAAKKWSGALVPYAGPIASKPLRAVSPAKPPKALTVANDGGRAWLETDSSITDDPSTRTVHSLALGSGANSTFDLPPKRFLFGESASSEVVLSLGTPDDAGAGEKLELLDSNGKSLGAWRPHADRKSNPFESSLAFAAALDRNRAVTVGHGRVTLWKLPEAEAVWTSEFPGALGGGLTPDGKTLFAFDAKIVRAFDLATGATLGNLAGEFARTRTPNRARLAFGSDGKRLSLLSQNSSTSATVWNLETGEKLAGVSSWLAQSTAFRALGEHHYLIDRTVFDARSGNEVLQFEYLKAGLPARVAPADGRYWYAVPSTRVPGEIALVPGSISAPDLDGVQATLAANRTSILNPGEAVNLAIELPADAPPDALASAKTSARLGLGRSKLTEDAQSPIAVKITIVAGPGGAPVQLRWRGAENLGREETVRPMTMETRSQVVRNGQVVWTGPVLKSEMGILDAPKVNVIDDDSKSAQEFFTRKLWKSAAASTSAPFFALGSLSGTVNGSVWKLPLVTSASESGLETRWPAGFVGRVVSTPNETPPVAPAGPAPTPAPKAGGGWLMWAFFGAAGIVLIAMVFGVVVLVRSNRKKPEDDNEEPPPRRARPVRR